MDHLLSSSKEKEDTLVKEQFSIPVVNVIWRMVASKTFTIGSEEGWDPEISHILSYSHSSVSTIMLNRIKVYRLDGGVVHTNSLCPCFVPSGRKISRQQEDPAEVQH